MDIPHEVHSKLEKWLGENYEEKLRQDKLLLREQGAPGERTLRPFSTVYQKLILKNLEGYRSGTVSDFRVVTTLLIAPQSIRFLEVADADYVEGEGPAIRRAMWEELNEEQREALRSDFAKQEIEVNYETFEFRHVPS